MSKKLHQHYQLAELITKNILDEASEQEKLQLKTWLEASPAHQQEYEAWMQRLAKDLTRPNPADVEQAWDELRPRLRPQRPLLLRTRYLCAYAATLLLAIMIAGLAYFNHVAQEQLAIVPGSPKAELITESGESIEIVPELRFEETKETPKAAELPRGPRIVNTDGMLSYNHILPYKGDSLQGIHHTLNVPKGGEYRVMLSDSTRIYVNSDSQIHYPVMFAETDSVREVFIKGEAYFNVAHNAEKPFRVHTQHGTIEVLGTKFNVHDYDNEGMTIVTLNEGSIKFVTKEKEYLLNPNEQLILDQSDQQLSWKEVNASVYSAWIDGIFEFNAMPLELIMKQLARWYDVNYIFDDPRLKDHQFTGVSFRGQNLEKLLKTIEKTTSIHFKIKKRTIHIY